jgi:VLRF1 release factor-like protein
LNRSSRPAAGGGRWVDVAAERLERFLAGFAERHGNVSVTVTAEVVRVVAADGATAECEVPFPPLLEDASAAYGGLVAHVLRDRRVGVLLVRRGGFAAGVFDGVRLAASKVGSRHVQGRTAAGGWSQQRFARRREGQTRVAISAAADVAAAVLLPHCDGMAAVVAGGDRAACDEALRDPRLAPLIPLLAPRRLDVPEPRMRVLESTPAAFRSVRVRLNDQ